MTVSRFNSLVDGRKVGWREWASLDLDKAWVDPGPSPAGNPGPYLKVPGPDDATHRVYPRHDLLVPIKTAGVWMWRYEA